MLIWLTTIYPERRWNLVLHTYNFKQLFHGLLFAYGFTPGAILGIVIPITNPCLRTPYKIWINENSDILESTSRTTWWQKELIRAKASLKWKYYLQSRLSKERKADTYHGKWKCFSQEYDLADALGSILVWERNDTSSNGMSKVKIMWQCTSWLPELRVYFHQEL